MPLSSIPLRRAHCVCPARSLPLVALLAIVAAGCGVSGAGGTPTSAQGTLSGNVVAAPTCPVERADKPCQPAPVANREVSIETPDGMVVARVTTNAQGRFSATLDPGPYVVHVAIVRGQPGLRQVSPGNATVRAGNTTSVTITLDTGIRARSTP
jgi:hypothetical protein